ncbi:MAG TPA: PIN domain-containing protein [Terriglobales bacterium]|nr:PIN domain-containing protein [Terriglobales bacterium]
MIVDTSVFSLVFRRRKASLAAAEILIRHRLLELLSSPSAVLLGPVRQELLSGISQPELFANIRDELRGIFSPPVEDGDFEDAAAASNACRAVGVAGSSVDFFLCGVSLRHGWPIFTSDTDFQRYAGILKLQLFRG